MLKIIVYPEKYAYIKVWGKKLIWNNRTFEIPFIAIKISKYKLHVS